VVGLEALRIRQQRTQQGSRRNARGADVDSSAAVCFFFDQLLNIRKSYVGIFGEGTGEDKDTEGERVSTFESKYGWLDTVNNLSNNDATKWSYFFNLQLKEFLNLISFQKAKQARDYQLSKNAR